MSRLDLNAATWSRLNALLDTALELPAAARLDWVESLGADCAPLKPWLIDLLSRAGSVETQDFLATIPKIGSASDADAPAAGAAGDVVGPYCLVKELGVGGMGSVWLAERADGLFNRPVALKLPHLFAPRAGLAERMAREREILATLDHPNIARLYEAGLTSEGQPYLALEYVEGIAIDRYLRDPGAPHDAPPIAARLRLFLQVADAVAYAHGKLILHRDLKPANMLVTPGGTVRLLDFGIAKLLENGMTRDTRLTQAAGGAMTPDYASPEQILGEPLGVASDVYSLGVVLYELLAGQRPYRLRRDSRGALEDAILQAVPPPLPRALRGDLETILQKALKKSPAERYPTVNAFADDLRRHLARRPVLARPDTPGYRLRRFVARNRVAVATGSVVGLALLGAGAIALWQAHAARLEKARAESVKNVLVGIFDEADPYTVQGKPLSAAQLLVHAAAGLEAAPDSDPRVRAELSNVLAYSLFRLGEDSVSEGLAGRALPDMRKALPADDVQIFRTQVLLALQLRFRGKADEARARLLAAEPQLAALRASSPRDFLEWYLISSDVAIEASDYERAIREAKFAYAQAQELLGRETRITARALVRVGVAYHYAGNDAEAVETARQGLALSERVLQGHPLAPELLDARVTYAKAEAAVGHFAPAIATFRDVIRAAAEVNGPASMEVGIYEQNVAGLLVRSGRIKEGIESAQRAIAIRLPQVEPASFESLATRNTYARALLAGRRARPTLDLLAGIDRDAAQVFGAQHARAREVRALHALAMGWNGDLARATSLANEVLEASRASPDQPSALVLQVIAQLARLNGDPARALRLAEEALEKGPGAVKPHERAELLAEIGLAALQSGDRDRAASALSEVAHLMESFDEPATPLSAEVTLARARLSLARGDARAALPLAQQAQTFWAEFDAANRGAGEAAFWVWRCQSSLGDRRAAESARELAARTLRGSNFPGDAQLVTALRAGV